MNRRSMAYLLVLIGWLGGSETLAAEPAWMNSPVKEMVAQARAATKSITIEQLKKAIDDGEDVIVVDVRTPKEYEAAHIPESVNLPRGLLEFSIWSLVPDQQETLYVYCKTGARAALAVKQLNDLGYANAFAVDTGGAEWVRTGYPIQTAITDEEVILQPVQ
ncbi:MAG: rhodanese-like domain-containing protein [Desulforhopalus sp.]|nr:rhodanese-like domain-containing protein [Desulforhopalus sp.]